MVKARELVCHWGIDRMSLDEFGGGGGGARHVAHFLECNPWLFHSSLMEPPDLHQVDLRFLLVGRAGPLPPSHPRPPPPCLYERLADFLFLFVS